MYKVTQTKVVIRDKDNNIIRNGNCYPAVIASLMELPIEDVPNFEVFYSLSKNHSFWIDVMTKWLEGHHKEINSDYRFHAWHPEISFPVTIQDRLMLDGETEIDMLTRLRLETKDKYYLGSGPSSRGVNHICIYINGELAWDPHPSREGLLYIDEFSTLEDIRF